MNQFNRVDTPTIMDGMVVRYRHGGAEISASRDGVSIHLDGLTNIETLRAVEHCILRAFRQYYELAHGNAPLTEEAIDEEEDEL